MAGNFAPYEWMQIVSYGYVILLCASAMPRLLLKGISVCYPSARVLRSVFQAAGDRFGHLLTAWLAILVGVILITNWARPPGAAATFGIFPAAGSEARAFGDRWIPSVYFCWLTYAVLAAGGFPLVTSDLGITKARWGVAMTGLFAANFIAMAVWRISDVWRTPFACLGIVAALAGVVLLYYFSLFMVARIRRDTAPKAADNLQAGFRAAPLYVQISDVHATDSGRVRTDGGPGGNAILNAYVAKLQTAIKPKVILVTGDLVDRGDQAEWEAVLPQLQALRNSGARVVLTPGNHDLGTAYDPILARRFVQQSNSRVRMADGRRLMRFLEYAALLEPRLECHDGTPLSGLVKREQETVAKFIHHWETARQTAVERVSAMPISAWLRKRLKEMGPRAISAYRRFDNAEGDRLIDSLVSHALETFYTPAESQNWAVHGYLRHILSKSENPQLDPLLIARRWQKYWYDPFPLQLDLAEDNTKILILNSNAPEPGLLGSAFGRLGTAQLDRLRSRVKTLKAKTLIVLMHHPICGWQEYRGDSPSRVGISLDRWALLSHDSAECHQLLRILEGDTNRGCRHILLCGGHRHEVSRSGYVTFWTSDLTPRVSKRVKLVESAALLDLSEDANRGRRSNGLVIIDRDSRGAPMPSRITLADLFAPDGPQLKG